MGGEAIISIPFSLIFLSTFASKCNSPKPETKVSPVSGFILTFNVVSSLLSILRISINLGKSCGCLGSIDFVTTGSKMCFMALKVSNEKSESVIV